MEDIFKNNKTYYGFQNREIEDEVLKDLYEMIKNNATSFNCQPLRILFIKSKEAKERLDQYELSAGMVNEDGYCIIQPLPISVLDDDGNTIRNPLVVADETEREAAREIVVNTPQAVVDSINT